MTEYKYIAQLITTDRDVGNFLANLCATYPEDPGAELGTFDDSRQCSPQAWYAEVHCKKAFADVVMALKAGADYSSGELQYLRERGLTEQRWELAKTIIKADVYQYLQEDGSKTPNHYALTELATANNYTIA